MKKIFALLTLCLSCSSIIDQDIKPKGQMPGFENARIASLLSTPVVELKTVSGTWTCPADVLEITIECWGAGGSGGSQYGAGMCGGASGGAYAKSTIPVVPGTVYSFTVAPATTSVLPTTISLDGNDGLPSFWADGLLCKAAGGTKGHANGTKGIAALPGASVGDVIHVGGNGSDAFGSRSGAGGGGGGSTGDGNDAHIVSNVSNLGGAAVTENGGAGGNGTSGTAQNGQNFAAGASGARRTGAGASKGGTSGAGLIRLTYTTSEPPPPGEGDAFLYFYCGQSLAVGGGLAENPDLVYRGKQASQIWVNSTAGFDSLEWGVNNKGGTANGFGAELSFCKAMDSLKAGKIHIMKSCQSGTSMYLHWDIDNNAIGRASISTALTCARWLRDQGKTVHCMGLLWNQGQADMALNHPLADGGSNAGRAAVKANYKENFDQFITDMKAKLSTDGFDIDSFEISIARMDYTYPVSTDHYFQQQIIEAQTEVLAIHGGIDFSTASWTLPDGIHTNSAGQMLHGRGHSGLRIFLP